VKWSSGEGSIADWVEGEEMSCCVDYEVMHLECYDFGVEKEQLT